MRGKLSCAENYFPVPAGSRPQTQPHSSNHHSSPVELKGTPHPTTARIPYVELRLSSPEERSKDRRIWTLSFLRVPNDLPILQPKLTSVGFDVIQRIAGAATMSAAKPAHAPRCLLIRKQLASLWSCISDSAADARAPTADSPRSCLHGFCCRSTTMSVPKPHLHAIL